MNYQKKYLKYKNKYLNLKIIKGGTNKVIATTIRKMIKDYKIKIDTNIDDDNILLATFELALQRETIPITGESLSILSIKEVINDDDGRKDELVKQCIQRFKEHNINRRMANNIRAKFGYITDIKKDEVINDMNYFLIATYEKLFTAKKIHIRDKDKDKDKDIDFSFDVIGPEFNISESVYKYLGIYDHMKTISEEKYDDKISKSTQIPSRDDPQYQLYMKSMERYNKHVDRMSDEVVSKEKDDKYYVDQHRKRFKTEINRKIANIITSKFGMDELPYVYIIQLYVLKKKYDLLIASYESLLQANKSNITAEDIEAKMLDEYMDVKKLVKAHKQRIKTENKRRMNDAVEADVETDSRALKIRREHNIDYRTYDVFKEITNDQLVAIYDSLQLDEFNRVANQFFESDVYKFYLSNKNEEIWISASDVDDCYYCTVWSKFTGVNRHHNGEMEDKKLQFFYEKNVDSNGSTFTGHLIGNLICNIKKKVKGGKKGSFNDIIEIEKEYSNTVEKKYLENLDLGKKTSYENTINTALFRRALLREYRIMKILDLKKEKFDLFLNRSKEKIKEKIKEGIGMETSKMKISKAKKNILSLKNNVKKIVIPMIKDIQAILKKEPMSKEDDMFIQTFYNSLCNNKSDLCNNIKKNINIIIDIDKINFFKELDVYNSSYNLDGNYNFNMNKDNLTKFNKLMTFTSEKSKEINLMNMKAKIIEIEKKIGEIYWWKVDLYPGLKNNLLIYILYGSKNYINFCKLLSINLEDLQQESLEEFEAYLNAITSKREIIIDNQRTINSGFYLWVAAIGVMVAVFTFSWVPIIVAGGLIGVNKIGMIVGEYYESKDVKNIENALIPLNLITMNSMAELGSSMNIYTYTQVKVTNAEANEEGIIADPISEYASRKSSVNISKTTMVSK